MLLIPWIFNPPGAYNDVLFKSLALYFPFKIESFIIVSAPIAASIDWVFKLLYIISWENALWSKASINEVFTFFLKLEDIFSLFS